jgi:hypothetical protein
MKKLTTLFLIFGLHCSGQNLVQNPAFTNDFSLWTTEAGWRIKSSHFRSTKVAVFSGDCGKDSSAISQSIPNLQRSKEFRLSFDVHFSGSFGTVYLDVMIDEVAYVTMAAVNGTASMTYREYSYGTNVPFSTGSWRQGFSVFIPWESDDSVGVLKFRVRKSGCSTRDVALDNINMVRNMSLPVNLTAFNVKALADETSITWSASEEHNCNRYVVTRKAGNSVDTVITMPCGELNYRHTTNTAPGDCYYYLTQFDNDGRSTVYGPRLTRQNADWTWYDINGHVYKKLPETTGIYIRNDGHKEIVK